MHDDITLTVGRVTRVLTERIWPAVHAVSVPFVVESRALPGEPVPPAEGLALDYESDAVGSPWGPAWGTTWFRLTAQVPAEWAGRRVEAVVDLGFDVAEPGFQCEGLVYRADGCPVKAVNPCNHWALVTPDATGGEPVELYVEAAANPVVFGPVRFRPTVQGDLLTATAEPLYATRRMDLAVFDEEVHALALDLDVLLGLQAELPVGQRRMRILQALDEALDRLDLADVSGTAAAARHELAEVLARPASASAHVVSAVGHAHIDSAWLWPVRETIRKVSRTAASMTALIDETEDFVFGMSSAQQYAWVKEHRPEVWARVVDSVRAGRFLPLGGMWVESDTVMPSGESMVRQFLYGQQFFADELGVRCRGVWLPDSFGYSPALPQLVRRAGFDWFFTQKISWNQVNTFPHHTFLWEGIDGSRVLTHFPPMDTYNSELSGAELALAERQFREHRLASGSVAPVGWGDGGGGTTREMTGRAERLADLEGSPRVRWEHPDAFYARTRDELVGPDGQPRPGTPVWVGELYLELHRATLTSQHRTKAGNRRCEHLLVEAELWAATAAVRTGAAYPHDELDALWKQVLLQQFHDILPGTSIAWVHREAVEQYARVEREAEALVARSLSVLVADGDRRIAVNGAFSDRDGMPPGTASLVPPVGTADLGAGTPVAVERSGGDTVLDNGVVRVVISEEGLVTSAVDLATGREAVAAGGAAGLLQLHPDLPNKWDAWDVDRFYRNTVRDLREVDSLVASVGEDGVATAVVERSISADSTVRQAFSLAPGSRMLLVEQVTDWHEVETFLKVAFPLDVRAEHTSAETQFGHHRRVTHVNTSWEAARFETSMHRFVHVEQPGFGVGIVNDSTYGYDVTRDWNEDRVSTTVRLSLLRAPRFPDPETDHGTHTHRYGLVVGAGVQEAAQEGVLLNTPGRVVAGGHGFDSLVRISGDGLALSSIKLAADRSGDLVVRVHEVLGGRASGTVRVDVPVASVVAVNLLEEPLDSSGHLGADPACADLELGPFEVRTLRFALASGSPALRAAASSRRPLSERRTPPGVCRLAPCGGHRRRAMVPTLAGMREPDDLTAPAWGPPWMRGRDQWVNQGAPPIARYVLAFAVGVIQLGGSFGAAHAQPDRRSLDVLAVVLLLVAPAAITVLRRFPVQAMAAIAAATATYLARGYAYGPVFLGLAIGLVATVVRGHRLAAWLSAAVVLGGDALGRLAFDSAAWSWQAQGGLLAWTLVVLAAAEVVRSWRERAATFRQAARETRLRQAGEERLRIAQELHDVVAHHMSLINVQAGVALHLADRRPEQVEPALLAIRDASKEALTELRSLIDVLRLDGAAAPRSPVANLAGLDDIVERSGHAGLQVAKTVTGQPRPLPAAVELAAYRIVQEAITNIVRHAHATRAAVALDYGDDVLSLTIEDNGDGGARLANLVQGNGISGMQERARALGGDLIVAAAPSGGLHVEAGLPTGGSR